MAVEQQVDCSLDAEGTRLPMDARAPARRAVQGANTEVVARLRDLDRSGGASSEDILAALKAGRR
ncbi:MAG: hypothetical protein M9891_02550 [Austwickia sp.]|nr:hypothetical protein [Actinomycetota bacterium]MCB1252547.1 hypothetical protein [Austwickia sp.]MCO5308169.1 hypothetical protein [Austwickia sp.]